jgi:enamine deaminase RidA (YjgF/YER057c/UK114 family)
MSSNSSSSILIHIYQNLVGPWSHVSKYNGLLYIAGQRGYDQETKKLVETNVAPSVNNTLPGYTRIKKAYQDMLSLAAAAGAAPEDCVVSEPFLAPCFSPRNQYPKLVCAYACVLCDLQRTVIYTTDMFRFRPTANAVTIELWGNSSDTVYPVRTIIEVSRLNEVYSASYVILYR